ncbi:MAG: DeoR/GlpR transcriptional regulator [Opitutales bacterium]|nr:DeoR/GlpR transcriptional regulator [Opitutales bacterium]
MLSSHRRNEILRLIDAHGSVLSMGLAEKFGVSHETIRKDLEKLAEAGRIQRVHGGATGLDSRGRELPLPARQSTNRYAKAAIAKQAASLIQANDTVFLDASSTVLAMTEFLPALPITVLTNAHHVVVALGKQPHYNLICTGGTYEEISRSYVGPIAEDSLRRYMIRWLFVGVDGLDVKVGASEVNPGQAVLKERLIQRAEHVCVVTDSSKLGRKSPFIYAAVNELDYLITDSHAEPDLIKRFEDEGIRVILTDLR